MAHPCIDCFGECYCNGDWDDVVVSKTPKKCERCDGCKDIDDTMRHCDNWMDGDEWDGDIEDFVK